MISIGEKAERTPCVNPFNSMSPPIAIMYLAFLCVKILLCLTFFNISPIIMLQRAITKRVILSGSICQIRFSVDSLDKSKYRLIFPSKLRKRQQPQVIARQEMIKSNSCAFTSFSYNLNFMIPWFKWLGLVLP